MNISKSLIHRLTNSFYLFVSALLMMGCMVGPDFVRPQPPAVNRYTHEKGAQKTVTAAGEAQQFEIGPKIANDWWLLFKSRALDAVVRKAIEGNPSLQAAVWTMKQSRDNLRAGYGVFFPQVDGNFGAMREKFSPAQFGGANFIKSTTFDLYTLEGTLSYTLDVFGGERRQVEGLAAQARYEEQTARAAYLTLVGNVVNAAIAACAYRAQIAATRRIIGFQKNQLAITQSQAEGGTVPYSNVLAVRTQLEATQASLPPLKNNLSQSQHLITALLGKLPLEWTPPQLDLGELSLPAHIPVTLPCELVRSRPDILAAEAQLHSASANIGAATAAMLPNLTLSGNIGQNSTNITNLFETSAGFWSLAANAAAPLFHGGTLWFERRAAIDAYKASLYNYRQVVVSAFQQVANSLRALEFDAQTLKANADSLETATQNLKLVSANYAAGIANYLQLLSADTQYQQARIGCIEARALRLQDTAALFVALGGVLWSPPQD
ncbi:MAG: efflux transporter outer membrane subunit [Syntrophobacteraceae bacterium]